MVRLAPLFNPSTPSTGSKRCNYKQSSFRVTIPSIPVTILIPRRYTQPSSPTLRFHFRVRTRLPCVSRSSPFPAFLSPDSTASRAHRFQERVAERLFERKGSRSGAGNDSTPHPLPIAVAFFVARGKLNFHVSTFARRAPLLELMVTRTRDRYFIIR